MRFTGIRLPLLAAVACASVGLSLSATDRSYGQAIYVYPTSRTILSTSYLLPRSYVVPSSYVFPSYIESAYTVEPAVSLLPTGYVETTYRRGLFGRRWIVERPVVAAYATSYVPTSYVPRATSHNLRPSYVPTTYVSAYAPTTYVSPTYYSTSYRVGRYRPTTYTYYPTTYYPTVYETAYRSSADICCAGEEVVLDAPVRSRATRRRGQLCPERRLEGSRVSCTRRPDALPSYVDAPLPGENANARSTVRSDGDEQGRGERCRQSSQSARCRRRRRGHVQSRDQRSQQPRRTRQRRNPAELRRRKPRQQSPIAPADDPDQIDLRPAPGSNEPVRRDSLKAIYPRVRTADRRNVLFGSVETDDGRPRGEVPVTRRQS